MNAFSLRATLTFGVVIAVASQTMAATIDCTNGIVLPLTPTIADDYIHHGGNIPCIQYTNTGSTVKTVDFNGHKVECDGASCLLGIYVGDGTGNVNLQEAVVEGPFVGGILGDDLTNSVTIRNNKVTDFMCIGIQNSKDVHGNILSTNNTASCGIFSKIGILWNPDLSSRAVEDNRIDCADCDGIEVNATHSSGSPEIRGNWINVDVASGSRFHIVDNSTNAVNVQGNVLSGRNDTTPASYSPIDLSGATTYSANRCDSVVESLVSPSSFCDTAVPFALP